MRQQAHHGVHTSQNKYIFKSAEIKTIARLAGYSEDIAGSDFKWKHHLV